MPTTASILSRAGQGTGLPARLQRWLPAHGLKRDETKARLVDLRPDGFMFPGCHVRRRRGRSGCPYPHLEPHPKSEAKRREQIREHLNHWTHWRATVAVSRETNRLLRGWSGYFDYG